MLGIKACVYILFFFINIQLSLQAQGWEWGQSLGGPNSNTKVKKISRYLGTDILIAGTFASSTLNLGQFELIGAGQEDGFVAVVDENGNYIWAESIGGTDVDGVNVVTSDKDGNIYLGGEFRSLIISIGDHVISNRGGTDGIIIKFNAKNSVEWVRSIGTAQSDSITGIEVDPDGNIYVAGSSSMQFESNSFLLKIDSENKILWERSVNKCLSSPILVMDKNKNLFLGGIFNYPLSVGNGIIFNPVSKFNTSYFILKYDISGNYLKGIVDSTMAKVNSLVYNEGLYICGKNEYKPNSDIRWSLAASKIHVAKYDDELNLVWQKNAGSQEIHKSLDIAKGISSDDKGNIYITGFFYGDTLTFANDDLKKLRHLEYNYPEVVVLKYSPFGEELWGKSFGGKISDRGSCILAIGEDQIYLGGEFESDSIILENISLNNTGRQDTLEAHFGYSYLARKTNGFLLKYDGFLLNTLEKETGSNTSTSIYPNPVNDFFAINFNDQSPREVIINIQTPDGRSVKNFNYHVSAGSNMINVNELLPGVYFLQLKFKGNAFTHKFIKI